MQYDAFKQGGSWLVYKLSEDKLAMGDPVSVHTDEHSARHALQDLNTPMNKGYVSPKPVGIFSRVKGGVDVFKGSDGLRLMFIVTSNSYEDRDDETIATPALKSYVDKAWSVEGKCLPDNEALFWHGGDPIGDVVWTDMEGPFLYEVIKERPNAWINLSKQVRGTIKAVWDFIESNPQRYRWGASHGFKFLESAFTDGIYKRISKFETSVLPLDAAANPYTFAGVINEMNRDKVLDDMTKIPGLAGKFRKGIRQVKTELDKLGLEHKAAKDEVTTKGMLDDARTVITDALSQLGEGVPEGFADTLLQQIVSAMSSGAGMEDSGDPSMDTGVAYNSLGDDPTTDAVGGKGLAEKEAAQVRLMDRLITSQGLLAEEQLELKENSETILKSLEGVTKALEPVSQVVTTVNDLDKRLKALEDRLKGAPKRAALSEETVIENTKITEHAEKMLEQTEELFPGTGIKLRKE